jgi:hypothetical protein
MGPMPHAPVADTTRPPDIRVEPPSSRARSGRRRRRRWVVAGLLLLAVAAVAWSYGRALTGPGNDALSIRSTEWLKDHHFAWAVNDVERWWYTHHQPKKGGTPTGALRRTLPGSASTHAPTAVTAHALTPVTPPGPAHLSPPPPIAPIVATPLPGEGQWRPLGQQVDGLPALEVAYLRPDTVHTSLVTAVAWVDPDLVRLAGYAGVLEPGGRWPQQAPIPAFARPALLATFNSGFKMRDARGGYYASGRYARPLVAGAATLVITADGRPELGAWGRDVGMGPDVAWARQNLVLIVDGGRPVPALTSSRAEWGATLGNRVLVWRSGVGITADGALVYAAGSGLSAASLADVLVRAGAVRAWSSTSTRRGWTSSRTPRRPSCSPSA